MVIYPLSLILYLSYNILLGRAHYTKRAFCHTQVTLFQGNNQIFHFSERNIKPGDCLNTDYNWDSLLVIAQKFSKCCGNRVFDSTEKFLKFNLLRCASRRFSCCDGQVEIHVFLIFKVPKQNYRTSPFL